MAEIKPVMTIKTAAGVLGVSADTVKKLIEAGDIAVTSNNMISANELYKFDSSLLTRKLQSLGLSETEIKHHAAFAK